MKVKLSNNHKNMICGAVTCIIGAFFFWYGRAHIKVNSFIAGFGTDSRTVPSAVFGLMFVLGVALIIQGMISEKRRVYNTKEFKSMSREILITVGIIAVATIIYVLLLQKIGFFVMSAVYMMSLFLFSKVKPLTAVIITAGVEVSLYLVFVVLLNVSITMNVLLI